MILIFIPRYTAYRRHSGRTAGERAVKKNQDFHVLYVLTKLELGGAQKVCLSLLKGIASEQGPKTSSLMSGTEGVLVEEAKEHSSVFLLKSLKREVGFRTIFYEIAPIPFYILSEI